jgi:hypothetical protein
MEAFLSIMRERCKIPVSMANETGMFFSAPLGRRRKGIRVFQRVERCQGLTQGIVMKTRNSYTHTRTHTHTHTHTHNIARCGGCEKVTHCIPYLCKVEEAKHKLAYSFCMVSRRRFGYGTLPHYLHRPCAALHLQETAATAFSFPGVPASFCFTVLCPIICIARTSQGTAITFLCLSFEECVAHKAIPNALERHPRRIKM